MPSTRPSETSRIKDTSYSQYGSLENFGSINSQPTDVEQGHDQITENHTQSSSTHPADNNACGNKNITQSPTTNTPSQSARHSFGFFCRNFVTSNRGEIATIILMLALIPIFAPIVYYLPHASKEKRENAVLMLATVDLIMTTFFALLAFLTKQKSSATTTLPKGPCEKCVTNRPRIQEIIAREEATTATLAEAKASDDLEVVNDATASVSTTTPRPF